MTASDRLLNALTSRGVDALMPEMGNRIDLRHAVHEAAHALDAKLEPPWTNVRVSRAMKRMRVGEAARSEIRARIVEQIVCKRVGFDPGPLRSWLMTSCLEAVKHHDHFFTPKQAEHIARVMQRDQSEQLEALADQIMALAEENPRAGLQDRQGAGRGARRARSEGLRRHDVHAMQSPKSRRLRRM